MSANINYRVRVKKLTETVVFVSAVTAEEALKEASRLENVAEAVEAVPVGEPFDA